MNLVTQTLAKLLVGAAEGELTGGGMECVLINAENYGKVFK